VASSNSTPPGSLKVHRLEPEAIRVGVEEMVGGRIVLIDAALHEAHTQDAGVEVEILLRGTRDRRNVMDAVDALHGHVIPAKRIGSG